MISTSDNHHSSLLSTPTHQITIKAVYWNEWLRQSFGYWNFVLIINLQRVYCVPHTRKFSLFVCLEEVWELIVITLSRRLGDRGGVRLYWPMRNGGKVRTPGTPRRECGRHEFVASYENRPRTRVDVTWGCASGKPNFSNTEVTEQLVCIMHTTGLHQRASLK